MPSALKSSPSEPHPDSITLALAEKIWPEAKTFLKDLVEENSYSFHPEGLRRNAERIQRQFAFLNFTAVTHPAKLEGGGEHLILDSGGDGPVVILVSHLDVVYTPEEQEAGYSGWQEEAERIVGPGTCDIKGGTVAMWMMLRCLAELEPERFAAFRWILAWNAAEEQLVDDFSQWVKDYLGGEARACMVFELDNAVKGFEILTSRKGRAVYRLQVRGRGAHSGNDHAEGANAIVKLSEMICAVSQLTDYHRGTTVNVGISRGGLAINRVPDFAEADFEIRYRDAGHFEEIQSVLAGWQASGGARNGHGDGCEVEFELCHQIPAWMPPSEPGLEVFWQSAGQALGITVTTGSRGGLSDGNFFSEWTQTVDGLGPHGGNAHSILRNGDTIQITEFAEEASFVPKTCLNVAALREFMAQSLESVNSPEAA